MVIVKVNYKRHLLKNKLLKAFERYNFLHTSITLVDIHCCCLFVCLFWFYFMLFSFSSKKEYCDNIIPFSAYTHVGDNFYVNSFILTHLFDDCIK